MPVCKVLAARLKIQLQQLSHSNVLPRAGSRCSGAARRLGAGPGGVSVAGNCFKIITETWQAGTLHVSGLVSAWGPCPADECAPPLARQSVLWSGAWPPSPMTLSGEHVCSLHHQALGSDGQTGAGYRGAGWAGAAVFSGKHRKP